MKNKLAVQIGKLNLKAPVLAASGTFGYGEEFADFFGLRQLGAIVTKTVTLRPRPGNLPPRTCEVPAGMLNSIGLENPGIEIFIKEKLPVLQKIGVPIIVSIAAETPEELVEIIKQLNETNIRAIELNLSCPNVKREKFIGLKPETLIAQHIPWTKIFVSSARKNTEKTLITKLSPNVTDITEIALAAETAGSDALALVNTLIGMAVDTEKRVPKLAAFTGGLSGPAIRPIAVRMVWETFRKIKIPIIGMGGIIDTPSALEFFLAGAAAVAVGTANFINPRVTAEIISGLKEYLRRHKLGSITDLTGGLKP